MEELSYQQMGSARDLISDVRQWRTETGIKNLLWWLTSFQYTVEDQILIIIFLHTDYKDDGYLHMMRYYQPHVDQVGNSSTLIYSILDTWEEAWLQAIEAGISYQGFRQDLHSISQIYK